MQVEELFDQLKKELHSKLHFLDDKPEETIDSTLRACWLTASGFPISAEEAVKRELPELTEIQTDTFYSFIQKRIKNVPLAYITGRQNFMNVELLSDNRALIPRKETEILGREALQVSLDLAREKKTVRVMDICCGSGNLGLAIAHHNPAAMVLATDLSEEAVELTKDNISFLTLGQQVCAEQGDLFEAFEKEAHYGNIDIIICNPPYISSTKVLKMDAEIADHEPGLAFDGGMFGTKVIQKLITEAPKFLTNGGWLLFEVGLGQGEFMMELCKRTGCYNKVRSVSDTKGNIRVNVAQIFFSE
jgi:release factor glutamine methyltransferase